MTKYEYKIVDVTWRSTEQYEMQNLLDAMGQDGWSLATQFQPRDNNGRYLYFQRAVPVTYDYIIETQPYWGCESEREDQRDRYIIGMGNLGWTLLHMTEQVADNHTTYQFVWAKPKK